MWILWINSLLKFIFLFENYFIGGNNDLQNSCHMNIDSHLPLIGFCTIHNHHPPPHSPICTRRPQGSLNPSRFTPWEHQLCLTKPQIQLHPVFSLSWILKFYQWISSSSVCLSPSDLSYLLRVSFHFPPRFSRKVQHILTQFSVYCETVCKSM